MKIPLRHADALYIAGTWTRPADGRAETVINPATEEILGEAAMAGPIEVETALAASRHAFDHGPWPRLKVRERAVKLEAMLDIFNRRADEIRALITAETGSTRQMTDGFQFATALEHARFYIDHGQRSPVTALPAEIVTNAAGQQLLGLGMMVREPVGVCVAITPYNVPFMMNVSKCFAALIMGNTVTLKPSPLTPFLALVVAEAADEAGLPEGAFNAINGDASVGEALTTDRRVDLVTFTGSDRVGASIQSQAAATLKRCVLELGGKSALIVCDDADVSAAARSALTSLTMHAGQACAATTRLLVHNSIRRQFVETLVRLFHGIKIGDPADPDVRMGPLIRAAQRERVEMFIESGRRDCGRLVAGGRRPPALHRGFFYEATLFDEVDNQWRIAREEIFGPVGVVIGFDTDEQAIAIANDSDFGLSGGVYSANVGRGYEIALRLRTGKVQLNGGSGKMSASHPFGGIKRSGYGRECGEEGLDEFTYIKSIALHGG